jgi:hypothetical protein
MYSFASKRSNPRRKLTVAFKVALGEVAQELFVGVARLLGPAVVRERVGHEELGLIGRRASREPAHELAEVLRRVVPALGLIVPLADLQQRVGRERAARVLLEQPHQHGVAVRGRREPVERQLGAALRLGGVRRGRIVLDRARERFERRRVVAGVVLALRQAQGREAGSRARSEVLEQARVATPRIGEALGLEVDVARARPRAFGERRAGAVLDHRLPAVHRVAGAAEAQVAQARLVERARALAVFRPALRNDS